MTRKFFFFSEMGYNAYPLEALEQYGYSALLFPNSIFDAEKARDLWQMFLREHEYASEMGFDGSVCNEHHNNVLSMAGKRQHLCRGGASASKARSR